MLKGYLIVCYAYKVKTGQWDLEPIEGSAKQVVPEAYRNAVAEYLLSTQ
jgi:hypothetical protein